MAFGWGIVGTGGIARQFAADLAFAPGARVAAVCSRSADKAEAFRAAVVADKAHADLDALLADAAVDAVYVATPNALHAEQALRAIAAGKPVLVEKPLALSAADAGRIEAAAAAKGVFAMEAMWTRFLPAIDRARARIEAGDIGRITSIRADLSYFRAEEPGSRFFDPNGGGSLFDLGVYPVSLAMHFLGRPRGVSGQWRAAKSGVDRSARIELRYDAATAHLSCGFDREGDNVFVIEGTRGALRLEAPFLKAQRLTQFSSPRAPALRAAPGKLGRLAARLPLPGRTVEKHAFPGGGLQFEAIAVMAAVRAGRSACAAMPIADSRAVLAIIEEIRSRPPVA